MTEMMSILSKRGLRQCFVLAFLMAILLSSMLLYWKISSSDSMNQTSQDKLSALAKPGLPVSSVSNEVVKEDDGNDDQIAYQKPCVVTASLWRLPATHFQHIPWNRKLSVANHAMELLGQPFDKKLQSFMRRLTNTTVCLKGVVTYMDVFEIVRHRYVPQLALNRTMTLSELMKQADVLKFVKGQEEEYSNDFGVEVSNGTVFHYRHDYKDPCFLRKISLKFDPRCDPDSTLDKKFQRQALIVAVQRSGTHYIWEMLNRLGLDLHHEGVGPNGAVSWLYAVNAQKTYQNFSGIVPIQSGYIINNPQKLTVHRFHYVFHQVRHPLRVISTLVARCNTWDKYWRWIARMTAFNYIAAHHSPLKRAMLLYWLWNRHMELYSDLRYRIEVTSPRDVCMWAKYDTKNCTMPYVENVNKSRPNLFSSSLNPHVATSQWIEHMAESAMWSGRLDSIRYSANRGERRKLLITRRQIHRSRKDTVKSGVGDRYVKVIESQSWSSHQFMEGIGNQPPPEKKYERIDLTWSDLEEEDLMLANELRIMSLEYGFPLDYSDMPQRNETYGFTA